MKQLIIFLGLFGLLSTGAYAQITTVEQAEADYRFQFDLYRTAYQQYQVDKSEFLRSETLKAEQEALESAKNASLARADVLRTYTQWLRLQLLARESVYPRTGQLALKLDELNAWYLDHKDKVNSAGDRTVFEQVSDEYLAGLETRNNLYLQSQIELKLGHLMAFRLEALRLFTVLRPTLESQRSIPEVEQGIVRVDDNLAVLETRVTALSEEAKSLEITDIRRRIEADNIQRDSVKELESLRQLMLITISILKELETRYGQ